MHEGSITFRLPAELREIERLNTMVRRFGDLHEIPSRALYAVNLALDEVVTNVSLYGFDNPAGQEVEVRLWAGGCEIHAELVDQGRAFNPLEVPLPRLDVSLQERQIGGLGLHLVRSLMDSLEYRRDGEKNVLTMMKRIR